MHKTIFTTLKITLSLAIIFAVMGILSLPFSFFWLIQNQAWALLFLGPALTYGIFVIWQNYKKKCLDIIASQNSGQIAKLKSAQYSELFILGLNMLGMAISVWMYSSSYLVLIGALTGFAISSIAILGKLFIYRKFFIKHCC